jgi:hypothetical protein
LLLAWIETPDCFNTLIEVGWGHQLNTYVYVAFRFGWFADEMSFAQAGPRTTAGMHSGPAEALESALHHWPDKWLPDRAKSLADVNCDLHLVTKGN